MINEEGNVEPMIRYEREILNAEYWKIFDTPIVSDEPVPKLIHSGSYHSKDSSLNVIDITDCDILTKTVIIEKKGYRRKGIWKEQNFKKITKEGEGGKFFSVFVDLSKESYLSDDIERLQRNLDLKNHNVFSDSEDINQVIKYYSNFTNVEF